MAQALSLIVIALLIVIDQLIKIIIELWLVPIESFDLLLNIVQLRYVQNTGAAFGMLSGYTTILSVITTVALIFGLCFLIFKKSLPKILYISLTLIIAGGAGNLIDRVFRGYVIDYIEPLFVNFAIFNFADSLVTVGAILLLGYMLLDLVEEYRKNKTSSHQKDDEEINNG